MNDFSRRLEKLEQKLVRRAATPSKKESEEARRFFREFFDELIRERQSGKYDWNNPGPYMIATQEILAHLEAEERKGY